jgi:hypothetical protein
VPRATPIALAELAEWRHDFEHSCELVILKLDHQASRRNKSCVSDRCEYDGYSDSSSGRAGGFAIAGPSKGPDRNRQKPNPAAELKCGPEPLAALGSGSRRAAPHERQIPTNCQTPTASPAEPGVASRAGGRRQSRGSPAEPGASLVRLVAKGLPMAGRQEDWMR